MCVSMRACMVPCLYAHMQMDMLANRLRRELFEEVYTTCPTRFTQPPTDRLTDLIDSVGLDAPELYAAASVLYWVAYGEPGQPRGPGGARLKAMPWVVAGDVLARVREGSLAAGPSSTQP